MLRKVNSSRRKRILISALISGLVVGIPALSYSARESTPVTPETARQTEIRAEVGSPEAAQDQPGESVEIQVIKITPFGFEPREIERSHKAFVLAIHNSSHKQDLSLILQRVQGSKLHEVRMGPGKRKWQLPLALLPGDYVLTEASQPEWRCQIRLSN